MAQLIRDHDRHSDHPAAGTSKGDGPDLRPVRDEGGAWQSAVRRQIDRKTFLRIVPLAFCLYVIGYADRVCIGSSFLHTASEAGLKGAVYGTGTGLFLLTYCLCGVPVALLLSRIGAARALTLMTLGWACIMLGAAFARTPGQLDAMRILLGAAQAAFLPAMMALIMNWFPARRRAVVIACFVMSTPVSRAAELLLNVPIAALFDWGGSPWWRYLLFLEAVLTFEAAILCHRLLRDTPADAPWLTRDERRDLRAELNAGEAAALRQGRRGGIDSSILYLSLVCLLSHCGNLEIAHWLPQLLAHGFYVSDGNPNSALWLLPIYAIATPAMVIWAYRSDRLQERRAHAAIPLFVSCLAMAACSLATSVPSAILFYTLAIMGILAFKAPFWTRAMEATSPGNRMLVFAIIGSTGNLGSFVGSHVVVLDKAMNGFPTFALVALAASLFLSFILLWLDWISFQVRQAA
jgi:ACS family tartrate transporter-like MFS transporter